MGLSRMEAFLFYYEKLCCIASLHENGLVLPGLRWGGREEERKKGERERESEEAILGRRVI